MQRMLLYTRSSAIPLTWEVSDGTVFPLVFRMATPEQANFAFLLVDRLADNTPIYREVSEEEARSFCKGTDVVE
jgi:hypothetical protein